jgi:GR25 family glycosyltransferase involved in LPS biosynthesis
LSHLNTWKTALQQHTDIAIIEDDIILTPNIRSNLDVIMQTELPSNWDILYLGCTRPCGKRISNSLLAVTSEYTKHKCHKQNAGAYAYIVRKKALPILIKGCHTPPFYKMVDHQMCTLHANPLNVYICNPPLVTHDFTIPSDRIKGKIYNQKYQTLATTTTLISADHSDNLYMPFQNVSTTLTHTKRMSRDQLLKQNTISRLYKMALT